MAFGKHVPVLYSRFICVYIGYRVIRLVTIIRLAYNSFTQDIQHITVEVRTHEKILLILPLAIAFMILKC